VFALCSVAPLLRPPSAGTSRESARTRTALTDWVRRAGPLTQESAEGVVQRRLHPGVRPHGHLLCEISKVQLTVKLVPSNPNRYGDKT
jgi:hypothetical protein